MAVATKSKSPVLDAIAKASKRWNISAGTMDSIADDVEFFTSGNIAIDYAIGGGIPMGRSIELYGPPSCGKTTTALQSAAELQKIIKAGGDPARGISADDLILYFDYEHAMDKKYAKALGLDVNHPSFVFAQPDTMEDGANFAIELIESGLVRLVIFDSVAAMLPSSKADAEVGKSLPAVQAKLFADFGSKMNPVLHNNNCTAIYLNHEKEAMDMGGYKKPGAPARRVTPGGIALKYFASVRVAYQQIKQNKVDMLDPVTRQPEKVTVSTDVRITVEKNKVAPPFRKVLVKVRFGQGFDNFASALQILTAHKKLVVAAGFMYFNHLEDKGLAPDWMARAATGHNRPYIRGTEALNAAAKDHPEWKEALIAEAKRILDNLKEDEDELDVPVDSDDELSEEKLETLLDSENNQE